MIAPILLVLFAEGASIGDTVGIAGWSSFGLAGAILCWLFFRHLPEKDRQMQDKDKQLIQLLRDHDAKEQRIETVFKDSLNLITSTFRADSQATREAADRNLTLEREACERHFNTLTTAVEKSSEATILAIRTSAEQINAHQLRNEQWGKLLAAEVKRAEDALKLAQQLQDRERGVV